MLVRGPRRPNGRIHLPGNHWPSGVTTIPLHRPRHGREAEETRQSFGSLAEQLRPMFRQQPGALVA